MKVYLVVSDQYSYLLDKYHHFSTKYWANQQFTVLCHAIPKINLPENFEVISIGIQQTNLRPLAEYIRKCNDDYFILLLDDQFIINYVNNDDIKRLEREIENGADKASLNIDTRENTEQINEEIFVMKQNVKYRTSVHPAIWTKEYFLRHMRDHYNWWDFETQPESRNDGAKIVLLNKQVGDNACPIIDILNVCSRNEILRHDFRIRSKISENGLVYPCDINILRDL